MVAKVRSRGTVAKVGSWLLKWDQEPRLLKWDQEARLLKWDQEVRLLKWDQEAKVAKVRSMCYLGAKVNSERETRINLWWYAVVGSTSMLTRWFWIKVLWFQASIANDANPGSWSQVRVLLYKVIFTSVRLDPDGKLGYYLSPIQLMTERCSDGRQGWIHCRDQLALLLDQWLLQIVRQWFCQSPVDSRCCFRF